MPTRQMMKADTYGIGKLISQYELLQVPLHQRDYAWSRDEVQQFLEDVTRAMEEGAPDYFLGLIVLVSPEQDGQPWQILDGQQRLATSTMVYSAIRQWLSSAGKDDDAHQIQSKFIGVRTLGQSTDRPRLTLNVNNRRTFSDLVVNKCTEDLLQQRLNATGRYSSDRLLIEATITCRERVAQLAQSGGPDPDGQAERLYNLANYLEDKAEVVCLEVSSNASAYKIFESLNDRGVDLSILDLVKNHVLGRARTEDLQLVQGNWTRMTANLGDRDRDDFLKVFWTSRFGRVQRGKLFGEFSTKYPGHVECITVTDELANAADKFAALGSPDHDVWSDHSDLCRAQVGALALLGNRQIRPVLMSALEKFEPSQMESLQNDLITLIVRYQVVGRRRTGAIEITCARVASQIFAGNLATPRDVWMSLKNLWVTDAEFEADFAALSETKASVARYLLRELEITARSRRAGGRTELEPRRDLTLEHILPDSPSEAWHQELEADPGLPDFTNRLGNLCLLDEPANRRVRNQGFLEKCAQTYKNSQLVLTADLAEAYDRWSREAIEKRQRSLAKLALQAWPLPHR